MTDIIEKTRISNNEAATVQAPAAIRASKSAAVQKLLARNKGATLAEIMAMTNWQPHSSRAFLTGLRKKGIELIKETRSSGETSWRIER